MKFQDDCDVLIPSCRAAPWLIQGSKSRVRRSLLSHSPFSILTHVKEIFLLIVRHIRPLSTIRKLLNLQEQIYSMSGAIKLKK